MSLTHPLLCTSKFKSKMKFKIYSDNGSAITSVKEWRLLAPPMNPDLHWKDYHSAKELAKSIFEHDTLGPKIYSILQRFEFPIPDVLNGTPEHATTLPWGNNGDRKHDLLLKDASSSLFIGIEAKADEPFDKAVKVKRRYSQSNADGGKNMSVRLYGIIDYLYEGNPPDNKEELMYQLISATTGTILEASSNNIKHACIIFLVFDSDRLSRARKKRNEVSWITFCNSLGISCNGDIISRYGVECLIVKDSISLP